MKNRRDLTDFAYDGQEAVDAINQAFEDNNPTKYALILMDCSMPFLDGFTATKQIREIYKNHGADKNQQPQILALTGHTEQEYVEKAINSGMNKVLQKPISVIDFGQILIQMKYIKIIPDHLKKDEED